MKILQKNKKAYFNYDIKDKYEAGIVLYGHEVKSTKTGGVNIKDSYVRIKDGEAFVINVDIRPYQHASIENYDPTRTRKLLLKKHEISKMEQSVKQKNMTLIPTKVYLERGYVKIEVGVGKGKKEYEKQNSIKERHEKRQLQRDKKKYGVV